MDKKFKEYIAKCIGIKIKEGRKARGFSQEQLAEMCDVTTKYISAIERGKSSGSVPLLIDICIKLNLPIDFIIDSNLVQSSNNNSDIVKAEYLVNYSKLKEKNKNFITTTINHLYEMQKD